MFSSNNRESIIQEIQRTGEYQGKTAYCFNILGVRAGFTSLSAPNDIKEYDNGVADIAATSNSTLDIVSSSLLDTAIGTGVRTVKVTYVDNSNNLVESAAITLNGIIPVLSVLTGVNQVLWMETATAGTGGAAAGNIRLRINGGIVEVEQITAGGNKSRTAVFMVPIDYTGYLVNWRASAVNNDQDTRIMAQVNTLNRSLSSVYHFDSQNYAALNTSVPPMNEMWMRYPATARIKGSTISAATGAAVKCNINALIVIIKN